MRRVIPLMLAVPLLVLLTWAAKQPAPEADSGTGQGAVEEEQTMSHGEGGERKNRLAGESSPYLLLHQENPVDWYPWGPEAIETARREERPIFLSVGYSTCYWCHVMERESFSDPAIAALMNRYFVNIKVDREERPDLDEIYMTATQILTGHGGWPNSVFLTPDLKPFYAGTYFPPDDRYGRPGFPAVLLGLAQAWEKRRTDVEQQAEELAATMRRFLEERARPAEAVPSPAVARGSLASLGRRFDTEWGGFGQAPKFPTPSNLFLLAELAGERPEAGPMLAATLDQMARGGLYDQLGGGFHRYATDREWKIPHFEKMLYDNGFLLELYAREHERTGEPEMARVARATAAFLAREMTSPEGAFWSAIDAETEGEEGAFYVWTREQLEEALGADDAAFLAPLYGFDGAPFFERHHYVLHLPRPLAEQAEARRTTREALLEEIEPLRARLFSARARRERPLTDDKILTDWNGIAIAGMATAGRILGEPDLVERAAAAARFLLENLRAANGTLLHVWRQGEAKVPAFAGDYAFLVRGLLALHEATGDNRWLTASVELAEQQITRLGAPGGGFYAAAESDDLLFRTQEIFDGAMPAANPVAVVNFLELAERTGEVRWRREAANTLKAFGGLIEDHPDAARMLALAAYRYGEGPEAEEPVRERVPGGLDDEARRVVSVSARFAEPDPEDDWRPFRIRLDIAPGWHVNAHPASREHLIPLELEGRGAELRNLVYPEGQTLAAGFADDEIAVYGGQVEVTGEIRLGGGEGELLLTYQACDDHRCLPPVTREITVE